MGKRIYVGNLPFSVSDSDLQEVFQQYGTVESARVIKDRDTSRSKGFGFVEMASDQEAASAITQLNGAEYAGRPMTVSEAKPMAPRDTSRGGPAGFGRGGRY
jgi:RNA recognition motif-containing protein